MNRKLAVVLVLAILLLGTVMLWPQSDKKSAQLLVGTWQAVDPTNAALHGRQYGAQKEMASFVADGSLTYHVLPTPEPTATQPASQVDTLWGWKVQNGRLLVRDMGEGSTGEWMQAIKVDVSHKNFVLRRKGFPDKEFTRVN